MMMMMMDPIKLLKVVVVVVVVVDVKCGHNIFTPNSNIFIGKLDRTTFFSWHPHTHNGHNKQQNKGLDVNKNNNHH